ncbi:MAG: nicotinate (nicotinamide) nucleotide adenylyltransferase [Pseudomonadota bacterium]
MVKRLGLFGGTFNPVHHGHIAAAHAALDVLSLDRLLLIPSGHPPLKGDVGLVAGHHRATMLRLAVGDDARMDVCTYEIEREGLSYTVDTVHQIASKMAPGTQLVFLVGSDCVDRLPRWKGIDEIRGLAQIAIIARSGDDLTPLPSELLRVPMPPVAASSTMVRKALANGVDMQDWIAAPVMTYLRDHDLYAKASCHA